MSKAPIKTPAKATVVSQKRQLQGEDKRVYEELRQDYNAARSDNIKKIIKACMDFIYEKRAPANGGEVLWALDEQANICSWKKHCELWADDLVKRKNSNEMIAMAGPELQMMAGAQDPARPALAVMLVVKPEDNMHQAVAAGQAHPTPTEEQMLQIAVWPDVQKYGFQNLQSSGMHLIYARIRPSPRQRGGGDPNYEGYNVDICKAPEVPRRPWFEEKGLLNSDNVAHLLSGSEMRNKLAFATPPGNEGLIVGKRPGEKEMAGPSTFTEHENDLPTPMLNTTPDLVHQAWYFGLNDAVIAPEQLEILRDLSIAESKAPMTVEQDTGMSASEASDFGEEGASKNRSSSTSSPATSSNCQPPQKSKRKRVANAENEDDDSGPDEIQNKQKRFRHIKSLEEQLACPYFKRDHLRGIHTIPDYCPRCHRPFDTVQLRNDHLREEAYEVVENLHAPDGITSQRMPLPGQRVLLKLSKEGQWFHLFDLPFPHFQPRPDSAYNKIASSGLLPNFRDFISQPSALEILLERVRINPVWTSKLEVILREDFVYGLNQIYPRWAATQDLETGQVPAIKRLSFLPILRPGRAIIAIALAFADYELEERKVDENDQPPPHQLNHEGIAVIAEQEQWLFADDYADCDTFVFTNDIEYGLLRRIMHC
ncbi:hypothetical protein J7T55_000735 [Diaporthe amygdali]|uniref:uncharacterized protein n=1 Tax=Phomopsis amygdali TaxID=1214568 RepID=UPI0022FDE30A|nr:uncharacterized protein J7T55_000735 [Diaporthe amygdali]KAJ0110302.1 hypothetical protein J7T55_000735 [Diaporthe amygdali]